MRWGGNKILCQLRLDAWTTRSCRLRVETAVLALCYRQSKKPRYHAEPRRQDSSFSHWRPRSLFTLFQATVHLMLFSLKAFWYFALPPSVFPSSSFCLFLNGSLCLLTKSGRRAAINGCLTAEKTAILDQALMIPIRCKHYYLPSSALHTKGTTKNSSGLKIRSLNSNLNYSYLGMIRAKLPPGFRLFWK